LRGGFSVKIKYLKIIEYKNLNNFELSFDDTKRNINFIVGKNGSGKSNLLESIATIFNDITNKLKPSLSFEIYYSINVDGIDKEITIIGIKNDKYIFPAEFNFDKDLPHSLVTYYSGIDNKYKNIVRITEEKFIENLKKSGFKPRILFNLEHRHFNYILISLLSAQRIEDFKSDTLTALSERCKIERISNIVFDIVEIPNLRGETKGYFDLFFTCKKINSSSKKIMYDQESLNKFREALGAERDVFKVLDILSFAGVIKDISVELQMDYIDIGKKDVCIDSLSLSEGEKQFITLLGISEFFGYKETLYLLDEPDAFLHPSWQANLNSDLILFNAKQQFIITTHSPNVIQTVAREDIFILRNGKVINTPHTLGRDINSILLEIMDTSIRPITFNDDIMTVYGLIDKGEFTSAKNKIDELANVMGENDLEILRMRNILLLESDE
jgi:predicted ATP-dependent endonuclease of OLD family